MLGFAICTGIPPVIVMDMPLGKFISPDEDPNVDMGEPKRDLCQTVLFLSLHLQVPWL